MQSLFQITTRMRLLAFVPVWIAGISALFYCGLFLRAPLQHRLDSALLGTVAITSLAWLAGSGFLWKKDGFELEPWDSALTKRMILYAWPLLPAAFLGYCMNWGNQVILRRSLSSSDVGLYQSAFQVHSLIMAFAVPLTTILLPKLIGKQLKDPTAVRRHVTTIAPTVFGLWLLAMIPFITFLPMVFSLVFGHAYAGGIPVLTALLVSTPLCALGQLYTVLYMVQGRMIKILYISVVIVVINLGLAWALLPHATPRHLAQAFSVAFAIGQYLMFRYQQYLLSEPAVKIHALLAAMFLFSISQSFIYRPELRIVSSLLGMAFLIFMIRRFNVLDAPTLEWLIPKRPVAVHDISLRLLIGPPGDRGSAC